MLPTDPTSLRFAARIAIAALAAHLIGVALGLPLALWAVITALFVVQMSVGGTIGAGIDRLVGTVVGAVVGGAAALAHQLWPPIPLVVLLVLTIAPLALFAVMRPSYRIAPITAALMLLVVHDMGQPLAMAFDRVIEIAIGCVTGIAVSLFVLPYRAEQHLVDRVAAGLRLLGELATTLLEPRDAAHVDAIVRLNNRLRALMLACEAASLDVGREHRLHLAGRRDPEPLFRTLRRLRSDVAIIDRAVVALDGTEDAATTEAERRLGTAIADFFLGAASALGPRDPPPTLDPIDAAIAASFPVPVPERLVPLSFAIAALRRDIGDLHERMTERATE